MTIASERPDTVNDEMPSVTEAKSLPNAWYVTGPSLKDRVAPKFFNAGVCLMPPDQRVEIIEAVTGRSDWPWMDDAECIMAGGDKENGYYVYFMRRRTAPDGTAD